MMKVSQKYKKHICGVIWNLRQFVSLQNIEIAVEVC